MQDRIFQVVSKALSVPVSALSVNSSPETVANWDSLRHMNLIVAIEEEFNIQFSDSEITDLQSMTKILSAVSKYNL